MSTDEGHARLSTDEGHARLSTDADAVAPLIAIVDYGMGNRRSVQKALEHVGARAPITARQQTLESAAGLILPGVGAFPQAMGNLRELGLDRLLIERARAGTPLLGICLGMQLLFDGSEELEPTRGLGLLEGEVRWLQPRALRLPHIGWSEVRFERPSPLLDGLPPHGCPFYHVHSLAPRPRREEEIVATTEYGERFATIVARANVAGVQFHPEKSSARGLRLLGNFVRLCEAHAQPVARAGARA